MKSIKLKIVCLLLAMYFGVFELLGQNTGRNEPVGFYVNSWVEDFLHVFPHIFLENGIEEKKTAS